MSVLEGYIVEPYATIVEPYGTTHTVMAPPGKLGLRFSRALNGVGIMCEPAADSVLKDKVTSRMMLVSVDGISLGDLDPFDISEMLNSRADKERKLDFVIDAADSANKQTKTVAVKNCSVKRVLAPGGRLSFIMCVAKKGEHEFTKAKTKFVAPADGLYGRINPNVGSASPLFEQLNMNVVRILAIEGTPASSFDSFEAAFKCLTANADARRTLVVQKLDGGGSPLRAVLEPTSAGTLKVTAIDTASPLLGYAAIGAEIVAVKGLDKPTVEGLASLPTTSIELTISTTPIARSRMEFISFFPLDSWNSKVTFASAFDAMQARGAFEDDYCGESVQMMKERMNARIITERYESVQMMKERMNAFLATSGLKVTSIETASIDGFYDRSMFENRHVVLRDSAPPPHQTLRVWYNALDPENLQPSVIEAVHVQNQLSAKTLKETAESCVVM